MKTIRMYYSITNICIIKWKSSGVKIISLEVMKSIKYHSAVLMIKDICTYSRKRRRLLLNVMFSFLTNQTLNWAVKYLFYKQCRTPLIPTRGTLLHQFRRYSYKWRMREYRGSVLKHSAKGLKFCIIQNNLSLHNREMPGVGTNLISVR